MRIRRSKPVDNFTIIPNATLRDERLSYCARGVLAELLSRPSGWEANADALSERARRHRGDTVGEGRRALRAAFKELEAAGYMLRRKEKGEKGRIVTVLEVFDTPQSGAAEGPDRRTGHRRTARGTSADGTSVRGTSASGTSIRSTEVRSTEEEDSFEEDATASSPAEPEPTAPAAEPDVTEGGGGGGSDLRSIAEHITAHLDYRGKPPTPKIRAQIIDRLVVALEAGWSIDGLAVVLDLTGQAIQYAPAIYRDRLDPEVMRATAAQASAPAAARGGIRGDLPTAAEIEALTVEDVFGTSRPAAPSGDWPAAEARVRRLMGATPKPSGYQPFQCPPASAYSHGFGGGSAAPAEAAATPWCGEPDCDPITRFRDADAGNGLKVSARCPKCHPRAQW